MWLFLILFLPLVFLYLFLTDFQCLKLNKVQFLVFGISALFGIIYVITHALLVVPVFVPKLDFWYNFFVIFLYNFLIPLLYCALIFFMILKNLGDFSVDNCFSFLMGFYSIYLPYIIFSTKNTVCAFQLFCLPFLYIIMLLSLRVILKFILIVNKSSIFLSILLIISTLLLIAVPFMIESMWYCAINILWIIFSVILYFSIFVLLLIFACKKF